MERILKTQSLLPWLEPGSSKIHLEISLHNASVHTHGPPGFPFRLLASSSPFFHLIHASYKTPSGTSIKEVFLLVQKDHCSFTEQNTPFNNSRIDMTWREACACGEIAEGFTSFDCLCDNSVDVKSFPLWRSLFYCAERRCYFHPPCPQCGNLLELCRDDALLSAAGLPPYATTLERFLFCPVCHAAGTTSDFFTYKDDLKDEYKNESNASHLVKSRHALFAGFEQMQNNGPAGEDFPCRTCPERDDCYGAAHVFSRIHTLAFYPFRMLITDAAHLPVHDFVHMLAGASRAGTKKHPSTVREPKESSCVKNREQRMLTEIELFFANSPKRFLEIFYLKLALLEQITTVVFKAQKHLKHPDLRLSMEQFWVELPAVQGLLPFFWNYKVKPLALGIFPAEDVFSLRVPESFSVYSLALMWFETLLVNGEQSPADVHEALAVLLDREETCNDQPDFFPGSMDNGGVFGPANAFWLPTPEQLPGMWLELWRQGLGLGWSLLQASFRGSDFQENAFVDALRRLAVDVKKTLFTSEAAEKKRVEDVLVEGREDVDSAILHILLSLQQKWRDEVEEVTSNDSAAVPEEVAVEIEPVVQQTVIPDKKVAPLPEEEQLEKTVILSADQLAAMMKTEDQSDEQAGAEKRREQKTMVDFSAKEDLEKTVIINVHDLNSMLSGEKASGMASEQADAASQSKNVTDGDISETVIISLEELEKLRKGKNGDK